MKNTNERCPLQSECGKKCSFKFKENECLYYIGNARPGCEIKGFEVEEPEDFWLGDENGENNRLVYLPTDKIYSHPDNPRKDVGDVSELADSIKESGILQNLTVVPYENGYRVIIGHRRLAASKLIGLAEVPCAVVDMDYKTQVATMLAENMQRVDLTVPEQVYGIQLMLDLGETVDEIQKKTGFSKSTVRHRIKMAELPKDKFQESVGRGATLEQYIKLEQIKDPKLKAKVLDAAGTVNFDYTLRNALTNEENKKKKEALIEKYRSFATEVDTEEGYERVKSDYVYNNFDWINNIRAPEDSDTVEYFFKVGGKNSWEANYLYLLKKRDENSVKEEEERERKQRLEREKRDARFAKLKEVSKLCSELRLDFVKKYDGNYLNQVLQLFFELRIDLDDYYLNDADVAEILGIDILEEIDEDDEDDCGLYETEEFRKLLAKNPTKVFLSILAVYFEEVEGNRRTWDWRGCYNENENLKKWYQLLCRLGYLISDAEKQLLDGTHETYEKSE